MNIDDLTRLYQAHGELVTFLVVFAKRMGVPVPVLPFLLLAGARGADDGAFAFAILALATLASVVADGVWFAAGRRFGRGILALVCRISISPDSCIRKSELAFAHRAAVTVVAARFIPGIGPLAPPLAGALGMRTGSFLVLNLAGTVLWTGSALAAGVVLREQVAQAVAALQELGSRALPVLLLAIAAYVGWLVLRRALITFAALKAPRIQPHELADHMDRGDPLLLLDVRGAMPGDARIPGAVLARSDHELVEELVRLPADVHLVTYCDCPNDVSAARLAARLRKRGLPVRVLAGGYGAWVAAGLPVQPG
ncbi:VTT domain-containing protein [Ramlibacter sp. USB13]|uniref:VTT domain-containing protein n=1 Tax=Ramlibacter cellulosilyticus TaxID=2764187 RepID=A0A923MSG1_9BURK|nr:rhodanese-like domain-containing protein [Ramlibacter cellulosilyticus]MBC5784388.1 VTT domain-containing protein [Ramlibacter cellulosilyticus]